MIKLTDILVKNKETGKKYDVKKVNPEKHEFAWDFRGSKENPNPFKKEKPKKDDVKEHHHVTPNERISKYKERIQKIKDKIAKAEDKNSDTVKLQKNQIKVITQTMNNFKQSQAIKKAKTSENIEEKWSQKYKRSIDCNNPKGFSQKAHCQGRKKNELVEEALELFLEKNCPTDPEKWSASKAAAKRKFDVYPSAYANGWAAKNYKSKGGGWKTCK